MWAFSGQSKSSKEGAEKVDLVYQPFQQAYASHFLGEKKTYGDYMHINKTHASQCITLKKQFKKLVCVPTGTNENYILQCLNTFDFILSLILLVIFNKSSSAHTRKLAPTPIVHALLSCANLNIFLGQLYDHQRRALRLPFAKHF